MYLVREQLPIEILLIELYFNYFRSPEILATIKEATKESQMLNDALEHINAGIRPY